MYGFIKYFLIFIGMYHILNTIIVYGIFNGQFSTLFSVLKDIIWLLFVTFTIIKYFQYIKDFIIKFKKPIIYFILALVSGIIVSVINGKGLKDIIIGYKYDLHFLIIILSSVFIGYIGKKSSQEKNIEDFFGFLFKFSIFIIIFGLAWQLGKMWFKDIFYWIGYGPLSDYKVGNNPPIYYLTGYQGNPRLSGIFAGPNNYGYLLVGLFSWFVYMLSKLKNKKDKYIYATTYVFSSLFTLSRGVIVGILTQIILKLKFVLKYLTKKQIIIVGIIGLISLTGLTIWKGKSSIEHMQQSSFGIQKMIEKPLGYGLGSAGPSIHHNGTILPENTIIQIILDIGIIGFVFWIMFFIYFIKIGLYSNGKDSLSIYLHLITMGIIGLFVEGFFLHVFEDSMVNYMLFIPWGILIGYNYLGNQKI